jgi:ADP-ribose pyrophosphatase
MSEDYVDEAEHYEAMSETGFWGRQGAGCIIFAEDTGRFLLSLRSAEVLEPHTWGIWGGAVPTGMDLQTSVRLEVLEETGYRGRIELIELCEYRDVASGFRYQNYLGVVPSEFDPMLNWESDDARWFHAGSWPEPPHFGLEFLLSRFPDPSSAMAASHLRSTPRG